jgi:recombination protein RecR
MSLIERLTDEFARLPGIGRKTALRLTYHVLRITPADAGRLAGAIMAAAERVRPCETCGSYTESSPCALCSNPRRDRSIICVVEEASDIAPIEGTGSYSGLYHVLGGRLSPLDGIGPDELNISGLVTRVRGDVPVDEVIIATNPSVEGEATALYVHRILAPFGVRVSRIARGLPVGGDLEYADGVTIAEALEHRRQL